MSRSLQAPQSAPGKFPKLATTLPAEALAKLIGGVHG
jgi:hypothetical protein